MNETLSPPPTLGRDAGPSTHDRLLTAAAALFAERGYGGTSMADIAERVGVRKASLYNYYPSKEELLLDLLRRAMRSWEESCLPGLDGPGPAADRLWGYLRSSVELTRHHADLLATLRLAASQIGGDFGARVEREVVTHKVVHRERLGAAIGAAAAAGEVAPGAPEDLAYAFRMFVNGVLLGHLDCNGGEHLDDERLRRIWELFWRGFGPRGEAR